MLMVLLILLLNHCSYGWILHKCLELEEHSSSAKKWNGQVSIQTGLTDQIIEPHPTQLSQKIETFLCKWYQRFTGIVNFESLKYGETEEISCRVLTSFQDVYFFFIIFLFPFSFPLINMLKYFCLVCPHPHLVIPFQFI